MNADSPDPREPRTPDEWAEWAAWVDLCDCNSNWKAAGLHTYGCASQPHNRQDDT